VSVPRSGPLQDKVEQLAADYVVAIDSVDATNDETQREIAKLRERAEQQTRKARGDAEQAIARMLDAGASPAEVVARVGITAREVRKTTRATPSSAPIAIGDAWSPPSCRHLDRNGRASSSDTTGQPDPWAWPSPFPRRPSSWST
jgi:DNA-binding protein H-NS